VLILLLSGIAGVATAFLHPERLPFRESGLIAEGEVTLAEAEAMENALWIDARQAEAWAEAHIPGAILLNEDEWEALLPGFFEAWIDPDAPLIIYCDSRACGASHQIVDRLEREMGVTEAYVLHGGWETWTRAGRPTEAQP
jgi:rhodanese-related sulfurtransferase